MSGCSVIVLAILSEIALGGIQMNKEYHWGCPPEDRLFIAMSFSEKIALDSSWLAILDIRSIEVSWMRVHYGGVPF